MNMRSNLLLVVMAAVALAIAASAKAQTSDTKSSNVQPNASTAKTTVTHDATLQGDGTTTAPLGVAAPLNLGGSLNVAGNTSVTGNSSVSGNGFFGGLLGVAGGISATTNTGNAIDVIGGTGGGPFPDVSGVGVKTTGGEGGASLNGGDGVEAHGGNGARGGTGLVAFGADSSNGVKGGFGAGIFGGKAPGGNGGTGMAVQGGEADGPGHTSGDGIVVRAGTAFNGASLGFAGKFFGDVEISGNLVKASGSFKIDHPLDPENKYLSHSFVESPDMMNIYNGTTTTDAKGNATVTLPDWFEALNQDFRYQLTVIGTFAQAIVGQKIKDNRFTVKTSAPNVEVSWQVTGIRHDAYANKHRITVEERKPEGERGFYLHPDAFNQPEGKGMHATKVPHQLERMSAAGENADPGSQQ